MANIGSKLPLTAAQVREAFDYDPETGVLWWRDKGRPAGCVNSKGYIQINFLIRTWLAHRVAWMHVTGEWPGFQIDHINGDKADNRWANLRRASNAENLRNRGAPRNNTSGFKGVHRRADCDRYSAQITVGGQNRYLGLFKTAEAAAEAYRKAAAELHGEFAHTG